MKALLSIQFEKINNIKVDNKLLMLNPQLFEVTKKTIMILAKQIIKFFKDHNIEVNVNFELIKNE